MGNDGFWKKIHDLVGVFGPACPMQKLDSNGKLVDWCFIVIPDFGAWDFPSPASEKDEDDIIEMLKEHLERIHFKRNGNKKKKVDC